jgi:hypothetical protein
VGFWDWIVEAFNGKVRRTSGSIILLDENRQEVMRWNSTGSSGSCRLDS